MCQVQDFNLFLRKKTLFQKKPSGIKTAKALNINMISPNGFSTKVIMQIQFCDIYPVFTTLIVLPNQSLTILALVFSQKTKAKVRNRLVGKINKHSTENFRSASSSQHMQYLALIVFLLSTKPISIPYKYVYQLKSSKNDVIRPAQKNNTTAKALSIERGHDPKT